MIFYILIFIISFVFLAKSGGLLVRSLTHLARLFNISEFSIAFILMSFATSIPELFVGISSGISGIPNFSFGNILGANLINITLIIGLIAIFNNGLSIGSKISQKNFRIVFLIAFLPILLAIDGVISRWDGLILLLSFIVYIIQLIGEKEYFSKVLNGIRFNFETFNKTFKNLGLLFLGTLILLASSVILVWSGKILAGAFEIGILLFGIIFVALGTTLPELAFGVRATMLKHESMAIGNSIGSVAFNSAFIVGVVSLLKPIYIQNISSFLVVSIFLFLGLLLFNVFVYTKSRISRRESAILIMIYLLFLLTQTLFRS